MSSSPALIAASTTTTSDESPPSDLPPVLVIRPLSDAWSAALSAKFTLIRPSSPLATSTPAVLVSGAFNRVDPALLDQYPSLKCVVTTSAGVNHINLDECKRRGVQVANVGETYSKDVADYAVGLLIDVLRRITMSNRYVRNGLWVTRDNYPLGSKMVDLPIVGSDPLNCKDPLDFIYVRSSTIPHSHKIMDPSSPDQSPPSDLPLVLILRPLSTQFSTALSSKFTLVFPPSPLSASARAMLLYRGLTRVDPAFLDQYPSLKCVVSTSVGVNTIDMEECKRRGILVSNAGEAFSKDVADHAVGLLIDVLRRITMANLYVRNGSWLVQRDYPLGTRVCFL